MTTTQPHDKSDIAIAAVTAQLGIPANELTYDRSNLLRNLLHIRHMPSQHVFIYSTGTGSVYTPQGYADRPKKSPF